MRSKCSKEESSSQSLGDKVKAGTTLLFEKEMNLITKAVGRNTALTLSEDISPISAKSDQNSKGI